MACEGEAKLMSALPCHARLGHFPPSVMQRVHMNTTLDSYLRSIHPHTPTQTTKREANAMISQKSGRRDNKRGSEERTREGCMTSWIQVAMNPHALGGGA